MRAAPIQSKKHAYLRSWFNARTARLNARGLTSRGTPMKQRRRVHGRSKADYQRMIRAEHKKCGLTVLGTVPKRLLSRHWAEFRATLSIQPIPQISIHSNAWDKTEVTNS